MEMPNEVNTKTRVLGPRFCPGYGPRLTGTRFLGKMVEGTNCVSKRSTLSTMAALLEPVGLIIPTSVVAKVLLQDLCLKKLAWDDPLHQDKLER